MFIAVHYTNATKVSGLKFVKLYKRIGKENINIFIIRFKNLAE